MAVSAGLESEGGGRVYLLDMVNFVDGSCLAGNVS